MDEIKLEMNFEEAVKTEPTPVAMDVAPAVVATAAITPEPAQKEETGLTLESLSENEKKLVMEFANKIDITNSNLVLQYGSASQNKIASFSDSVLANVKSKDLGDAGGLLTELVVELKNYDSTAEEKGFFGGLFGGAKKKMDKMVANYSSVEDNVSKITVMLEMHQMQLMKDITLYDNMYQNNLAFFKEVTMYIIAGKEKLKEATTVTLPQLQEKANATTEQVDIQNVTDMNNFISRFDKKVHDLMLSRVISMQMGPQIRLLQNNDAQLVDKIQSSIVNAIPLWKNQMVISLGLANAKAALGAQKQVTDMTNQMLQKNSEMLKQGSLEIAQESERSIVSIETVQKTNQDLIETINGVLNIQKEGMQKRAEAEAELLKIEVELKKTMLTVQNKN